MVQATAGPVPGKLGSGLDVMYRVHLQSQGVNIPQAVNPGAETEAAAAYLENAVQDGSGRIRVLVHLDGDVPASGVAQALTQTGKFVVAGQSSSYRRGVVDGWVQVADLATVAKVSGVKSVVLSVAPVAEVGNTTQQGVVQHRVDQISSTYDGTGITIGVMSDTYNFSTAVIKAPNDVASGDLPGAGNPVGNTQDVVIIEERATQGSDEGRAMAQLVHDIAPKAKLGFATAGSSQLQFADNIRSLAGLPGAPRAVVGFNADIIVDDVIFLTEPMFSDGIVAQGVIDVTNAGKHYFSSAGNRASTQGYAANFNYVNPAGSPTTGSNINLAGVNPALYAGGFHNFRTDGGQDIAQTIRRTSGTGSSNARIVFQWDDPFDVVVTGTNIFTQTATFTGTPAAVDFTVAMTAGTPSRVRVRAINGSAFDAIVTIIDPLSNTVINAQDTDTDETIFFTPNQTGNYTVRVTAFNSTTGDYQVDAFANSSQGVTTEYNVLWFRSDTGAFITATQSNALIVNQPVVFTGTIPIPSGQNTVQMVIARSAGNTANRLRYVFFDGSTSAVRPDEYISYQYPITYGHNSAANGHGVAAFSAFRPYIPESFTSPGPVTIMFDNLGNRLAVPEIRQQPVISAMDGANNTFFGGDNQGDADTFPNFFGTSAAAPNAAAVAALVLQAKGGPGSLTVAQMKNILINSTMPNDLDPQHAEAVIKTNGGTLTITLDADYTNASAVTTTLPLIDPNVFKVSYSGSGSVATLSLNGTAGNTTGGNETAGNVPGMVFDVRAIGSSGLPVTFGQLTGITSGDITTGIGAQAPAPATTNQSHVLNFTFASGTFANGDSFGFNVDRDELRIFALPDLGFGPQIGNSGDLFGANVSIPQGAVNPGGVTVTGTMADGTAFSGTFVNKIGRGYSPLTGYGFLDAQRAVSLATNVAGLTVTLNGSGTGTVVSAPGGINCATGSCSADFTTGASIQLTATANSGSQLMGFTGCTSVASNVCTVNPLAGPSTVTATFTAITAPDSPVITSVVRGNGSATVNFTPPAYDGLSPVLGYAATCGSQSLGGATSPITVTGLTNGTQVACVVVATNAIGNSPPSNSVNVTPATLPDAPTIGTATAGDGQATVSFTAPVNNGGAPVTNYTVTSNPGGITASGSASPITVTGLTNGVAYTFTVTATNSVGTGAASAATNSVTPVQAFLVSVIVAGGAGNSVSSAPAGITCGGDCSESYASGTSLTLTAAPGAGFVFSNWSGVSCTGGNSSTTCTFNVTAAATVTATFASGTTTRFDFNDDGTADILLRNPTTGENYLYPMNGTTILGTEGYIRTVSAPWGVAGIGDFDGNGTADILLRNSSTGENYIYFMNGTTIATEGYIRTVPTDWAVAGVADLDGDGKADILLRNTSSGDNYLYPMDGLTIKGTEGYIRNVPLVWAVAGVADLDGDGKGDILLRNTSTGENYLYPMDGTTIKGTEGYIRTVALAWEVAGLGDFDGDGKADILLRNTSSGENYLYPMDGTTIKGTEGYIRTVPTAWVVASVADFDGDGKVDILLRNTSTGENYLYPMDGTTIKGTEGYIRTVPLVWTVVSK
jgi:hypothetical protein